MADFSSDIDLAINAFGSSHSFCVLQHHWRKATLPQRLDAVLDGLVL